MRPVLQCESPVIPLHPLPDVRAVCPHCQNPLTVTGWYLPGMRALATLLCSAACQRRYYVDVPTGHGLAHPMLLEHESGEVHDPCGVNWFSEPLRAAFARRTGTLPWSFSVEKFTPTPRPLILNCLDNRYGHSLLKLLNAQHHLDHDADWQLVVIVPKPLRWMVPQDVAEIWTVDCPPGTMDAWDDHFAAAWTHRLADVPAAWISVATSHPMAGAFAIERFTGVAPFPMGEWGKRALAPVVTFVWREDRGRIWGSTKFAGLKRRFARALLNRAGFPSTPQLLLQADAFAQLTAYLREHFPRIDLAVVGLGMAGSAPPGVQDLRVSTVTVKTERMWCERYARSHVVVGVHGSNMLLPSAHAGAVVELVPDRCWRNILQDIQLPELDPRWLALRCRCLPLQTTPADIAGVVVSMVEDMPLMRFNLDPHWNTHHSDSATWAQMAVMRRACVRSSSPQDRAPDA